ncbi:hypothetical protein B0H11DRAFT_1930709 [Mycena galericulata]|nr:hypothetical protein B0H11DRAFT_1930709 [Mycena galericulata]
MPTRARSDSCVTPADAAVRASVSVHFPSVRPTRTSLGVVRAGVPSGVDASETDRIIETETISKTKTRWHAYERPNALTPTRAGPLARYRRAGGYITSASLAYTTASNSILRQIKYNISVLSD